MSAEAPSYGRRLSLIVAASENEVIGRDGDLPWHLPADLRHFKRLTTGHTMIMGRRTFESIGRALPKRRSIVLSRDPAFRADGVEVAAGFDRALAMVEGEGEVFVIGGHEVFRRALPHADRLYLTRVHAEIDGDVKFPAYDPAAWEEIDTVRHEPDARHAHAFSFCTYQRRASHGEVIDSDTNHPRAESVQADDITEHGAEEIESCQNGL